MTRRDKIEALCRSCTDDALIASLCKVEPSYVADVRQRMPNRTRKEPMPAAVKSDNIGVDAERVTRSGARHASAELRAAMEEQFAKFAKKYGHPPHWGRSMLLNWGEPS